MEEVQQEKLMVGNIDVLNLPPNARALTKLGRPYNKLAEELHTHIVRRTQILEEYRQQMEKTAGLMNELVRSHIRIDQILDEASPEGMFPKQEENGTEKQA